MKPLTEEHLTVLRRHMVEVIAIHADLMSDEIGKTAIAVATTAGGPSSRWIRSIRWSR